MVKIIIRTIPKHSKGFYLIMDQVIHTKYEKDEITHIAKQIRNQYHNRRRVLIEYRQINFHFYNYKITIYGNIKSKERKTSICFSEVAFQLGIWVENSLEKTGRLLTKWATYRVCNYEGLLGIVLDLDGEY